MATQPVVVTRRSRCHPESKTTNPIDAFIYDRVSRGLSVATIKFYKDYLQLLQKGIKSPLLVTTKSQVQGFIRNLDCSPGGKHACLRAARAFFNWALEEQHIGENPCKHISVNVPNPDRYTLTIERLELLLGACETELQKSVYQCLLILDSVEASLPQSNGIMLT